ncbi:MAG: hypothetical protein EB116_15260, partial [Betaproteobacteria bacterium]|nr:hypothetical protein [Betaproteobacteria bacterium]
MVIIPRKWEPMMPNKLLDMMYAPRFQDGGALTPQEIERLNKLKRASQLTGYGEGPGMRAFQEMGDVGRGLLGAEAIIPGGEGYRTGQALANMPAVGLAAVPGKVASALPEVVTGLGTLGAAGVIKPKGGNWLAGSFSAEKALGSLKRHQNPEQELAYIRSELEKPQKGEVYTQLMQRLPLAERSTALNKWIDTKLTKYVKNEMATPEDPIRALAERGTLHYEPQDVPNPIGWNNESRMLFSNREAANYPTEGLGKSNLARDWETLADLSVQPDKAEVFLPIKSEIERNPWLEKVSPDTPVYGMNLSADLSRLGFPHIIDELTNAMNPNSGLPASLRLTPQQLEKVTVPQAVERVAKINEWRAAQKAEADALRARNPAVFEYRAYENVPGTELPNNKGLRWVELKLPEVTSPGQLTNPEAVSKYNQYLSVAPDNPEVQKAALSRALRIQNEPLLEDALKYEGDIMGHCVGGYCPDVIEGRSKIYSLRDKKGEPHVTIEVKPSTKNAMSPAQFYQSKKAPDSLLQRITRAEEAGELDDIGSFDIFVETSPEYQKYLKSLPPDIAQIKGKANKAPKDEYLPFVQDFVRSGNWSRVDDLQNTGLIAIDRGSDLAAAMKAENAT